LLHMFCSLYRIVLQRLLPSFLYAIQDIKL
jgi:hypothetical protein